MPKKPKPEEYHADIAILAIRQDEFGAVVRRLAPQDRFVKRAAYQRAVLKTNAGNASVVLGRSHDTGQGAAQAAAHNLIEDVHPTWLFVVGIGGAFPAPEYSLGDVLVSNRLHDFSVNAFLEGSRIELSVRGDRPHPDVAKLLDLLIAENEAQEDKSLLRGWNSVAAISAPTPEQDVPDTTDDRFYGPDTWRKDVRNSLLRRFGPTPARTAPTFYVGPLASGNTLLKDASLADQWRRAARDTTGVEMELGGVYEAAHDADCRVIAIRGISDVVGFKRRPEWTAYACDSAASLAIRMITSGFPLTIVKSRTTERRVAKTRRQTLVLPRSWERRPAPGHYSDFAFLSVQVAGYGHLFREGMPQRQIMERAKLLGQLQNSLDSTICGQGSRTLLEDLEWDRSAKGVMYGFPATDATLDTPFRVFQVARTIVEDLPLHSEDGNTSIHLRVAIDIGKALFHKNRQQRVGSALNIAAEIPSGFGVSSLNVTADFLAQLPQAEQRTFYDTNTELHGKRLFTYLPCAVVGHRSARDECKSRGHFVFASHHAYRLFELYLASGDLGRAGDCLNDARAFLAQDTLAPAYFSRVLARHFRLWEAVVKQIPPELADVNQTGPVDLELVRDRILNSSVVVEWIGRDCPRNVAFLRDVDFILRQLRIFADTYADAPTGLSTLQVTRLLLRAGFPPHYGNGAITRRIGRIREEMGREQERSLDGECSLCTGTALSCLSLAGLGRDALARNAVDWLRTLKGARYSHIAGDLTTANADEHALHYAASVLQGLIDFDHKDSTAHAASVTRVFLESLDKLGSDGFYREWMRYRNISSFEVCEYVFAAFLRLKLLDGERVKSGLSPFISREIELAIVPMLSNLVRLLADELVLAWPEGMSPNHYAVRTNLPSLCLAAIYGDVAAIRMCQQCLRVYIADPGAVHNC